MKPNPKTLSTLFRLVLGVAALAALAVLTALAPHAYLPASAGTGSGTIAYVRSNDLTGDEIRLVEPPRSGEESLPPLVQ